MLVLSTGHSLISCSIPLCRLLTSPALHPLTADPADPKLRAIENAFLLGPLLVAASTEKHSSADKSNLTLPKGSWRSFDFDDFHPDLPLLLLRGGAIIPAGKEVQHTGENKEDDPITLIVSLDENGTATLLLAGFCVAPFGLFDRGSWNFSQSTGQP